MKTVFVNKSGQREFGATLEPINPTHLYVDSKIRIGGYFYIIDDSFVSIEHNKSPELVVVVHKVQ